MEEDDQVLARIERNRLAALEKLKRKNDSLSTSQYTHSSAAIQPSEWKFLKSDANMEKKAKNNPIINLQLISKNEIFVSPVFSELLSCIDFAYCKEVDGLLTLLVNRERLCDFNIDFSEYSQGQRLDV